MNSNFSQKKSKINAKCDIYALGAIIYKLLVGKAPNAKISKYIAEKQFHLNVPQDDNVYPIPAFFKNYVLSNDIIYIIVKLLH